MRKRIQKAGEYLECEKRWVFLVLIFVAGFYGGYTLSVRGGVFCNAQTANMALFAVALGKGEWSRAAYYLIPMSAYLLGTIVSEAVPKPLRRTHLMRWDTMLTLIEILAVIIVGFVPRNVPDQICQVIINFICAMQYNTFRQAEGISMATTFCTNHIRMFGSNLTKALRRDGKHPDAGEKTFAHGIMLLSFVVGVVVAVLLCRWLDTYAIWCALIPLAVLFVDLLHADLTTEKDKLEIAPHGH
jgi:uncharacterized membrane protein YoaK (UPF0700 family)